MGRPKKQLGNIKSIECVQCGKECLVGLKADFTLSKWQVTEDFFISFDHDIEDYDAFFCSK